MRGLRTHERPEEGSAQGCSIDRVGHVYYWSLSDELILVVSGTPALLSSGRMMWECYSLETAEGPWWLSEHDMSFTDGMFARVE